MLQPYIEDNTALADNAPSLTFNLIPTPMKKHVGHYIQVGLTIRLILHSDM